MEVNKCSVIVIFVPLDCKIFVIAAWATMNMASTFHSYTIGSKSYFILLEQNNYSVVATCVPLDCLMEVGIPYFGFHLYKKP